MLKYDALFIYLNKTIKCDVLFIHSNKTVKCDTLFIHLNKTKQKFKIDKRNLNFIF